MGLFNIHTSSDEQERMETETGSAPVGTNAPVDFAGRTPLGGCNRTRLPDQVNSGDNPHVYLTVLGFCLGAECLGAFLRVMPTPVKIFWRTRLLGAKPKRQVLHELKTRCVVS